jgi:hypothetical protein
MYHSIPGSSHRPPPSSFGAVSGSMPLCISLYHHHHHHLHHHPSLLVR